MHSINVDFTINCNITFTGFAIQIYICVWTMIDLTYLKFHI